MTLKTQMKTTLYLGRNVPTGPNRTVSDSDLERFLSGYVAEWFRGFTVIEAIGYWKGEPERTAVVVFLHDNSEANNVAIETIRVEYCARFYQEATVREDTYATVDIG